MKKQKNKSKYSAIRTNQVLNKKGKQDFTLVLPVYSSSSISVFTFQYRVSKAKFGKRAVNNLSQMCIVYLTI